MTNDEIIAKQQIEIENLREWQGWVKIDFENIRSILYCIGGPLNDNVLNYSKEQLSTFFRIADIANDYESKEEI